MAGTYILDVSSDVCSNRTRSMLLPWNNTAEKKIGALSHLFSHTSGSTLDVPVLDFQLTSSDSPLAPPTRGR